MSSITSTSTGDGICGGTRYCGSVDNGGGVIIVLLLLPVILMVMLLWWW